MKSKPTDLGKNLQKMLKESLDRTTVDDKENESVATLQKPAHDSDQQISEYSSS